MIKVGNEEAFIFAYSMVAQTDGQKEAGTHVLRVFVWKVSELDSHGDPQVSPCMVPEMLISEEILREYSFSDFHEYVGKVTTQKINDALAAGPGDPLYDRIQQQRVKLT